MKPWQRVPLAKPAPMDEKNGALLGYVTLCVARDMEADGMWDFAMALNEAGTRLVVEHGRLPEGIAIPADVYQRMYDSVVEGLRQGAQAAWENPEGPKH